MTKSFLLRLLRVAYSHPALSYPFHVLLVPKKPIPTPLAPPARAGVSALDPVSAFLPDVIATAQGLVEQFHLPACRLIVNGGECQDFPYLHFHLISGRVHFFREIG